MKRHPVDSVSLVFALLFSAAVAWWGIAMISSDPLHLPAAWIGAGTLLVIGLVGLVSALRPQRRPAEAPLTVPQAPQAALDVDPYNDPFLASMSLPRVDGVLDADAIAAAYRDAGFEDPVPVSPAKPAGSVGSATAVAERPATTAGRDDAGGTAGSPSDAERPADSADSSQTAGDAPAGDTPAPAVDEDARPTAQLPLRSDTKELPADRDGSTAS
ncbi:hypothetical protein [Cryptosporangium aurantiacum]|uniref:Uncharacterized protein n=1 Tax=Cryptosporangium aurantiacum TaxID=134849 RepID=A0A1M7QVA6_9ACTN|nr:hypothetical protein [Cryptosporangium aurantiacum]SHN35719.1 hypothetical protein SAMN05443668_105432 [Cryptosporangium aurantiacum]